MANPVANLNLDEIMRILALDPRIHRFFHINFWMCRHNLPGQPVIRRVAIRPWNDNDIRIGWLTAPSDTALITQYTIPAPHMVNGIWVYDNMVQDRVNAITTFVLNCTPLQMGGIMILHECLTMLHTRLKTLEQMQKL